jgi:hypothetical protein
LLLDAHAGAANAVCLAFSTIKGITNESIDELPDEASITVERHAKVEHSRSSRTWLSA